MPENSEGPPTRLDLLSKELLVAREIFAAQIKNEPVYFNRLVDELEGRRLASRSTVSKALDMLFDQGIVRADWVRRDDGKFIRSLKIAGEAKKFIEAIYKNTR